MHRGALFQEAIEARGFGTSGLQNSTPTPKHVNDLCQLIEIHADDLLSGTCSDARRRAQSTLMHLLQSSLPMPRTPAAATDPLPGPLLPAPALSRRRTDRDVSADAAAAAAGAPSAPLHPPVAAMAAAWKAATPALNIVLQFEEADIIEGVIEFWREISSKLEGVDWLDCISSSGDDESGAEQAAQCLHQQRQQRYIRWLWQTGPELVAAVVSQAHSFFRLTGISHLCQRLSRPTIKMLLMLLQLTTDADAPTPAAPAAAAAHARPAAAAAQMTPAQQLLELLGCHSSSPSRGTSAYTLSAWAAPVARALTCGDGFSLACQLLQLSASDPGAAQWEGRHRAAGAAAAGAGFETAAGTSCAAFAGSAYAACGMLPPQAATFLLNGYGAGESWGSYSSCMLSLLRSMTAGPGASGAKGMVGMHASQLCPQGTGKVRQQRAGGGGGGGKAWSDGDAGHVRWCESAGFRALCHVVSAYPRWDLLVRGYVRSLESDLALAAAAAADHATSFQSSAKAAVGDPASLPGAAAVKGKDGKGAASNKRPGAAAAGSGGALPAGAVLGSLAEVAHAAADAQQCAARTASLLFGLSELLRQEAGCGVEWRCEALGRMEGAVGRLLDEHPGAEDLIASVWAQGTLDSLFTCMLHDPSIKVRRAALCLASSVAVPAGSPAAANLIAALTLKSRDKDSAVAAAALELLVQLPLDLIARQMDGQGWFDFLVAGLGACCTSTGGSACSGPKRGGQRRGLTEEGRRAFLGLLAGVLQSDVAITEPKVDSGCARPAAPSGNAAAAAGARGRGGGGGRGATLDMTSSGPVGLAGCRRSLVLLLHDPGVAQVLESIAAELEAAAAAAATAAAPSAGTAAVAAAKGTAEAGGPAGSARVDADLEEDGDVEEVPQRVPKRQPQRVGQKQQSQRRRLGKPRKSRRAVIDSDSDDEWDSDEEVGEASQQDSKDRQQELASDEESEDRSGEEEEEEEDQLDAMVVEEEQDEEQAEEVGAQEEGGDRDGDGNGRSGAVRGAAAAGAAPGVATSAPGTASHGSAGGAGANVLAGLMGAAFEGCDEGLDMHLQMEEEDDDVF